MFFDKFVAELAAKTAGEIGAVFYGDSQLGPEDKYTTQINFGTLDMMLTGSDWTPIVPELGVMTLGFLFTSMEQQGAVMDGSAGPQIEDIFKHKTKAEILGWGFNFGGRNVLSKRVVATPADLRGLKLRVLPSPYLRADVPPAGRSPRADELRRDLHLAADRRGGRARARPAHHPAVQVLRGRQEPRAYRAHLRPGDADRLHRGTRPPVSAAQQQAVRDAAAMAIQRQRGKAASAAAPRWKS